MSTAPLMPKATAVWLVENTSLTFDQIADFCKLHPLEVKGIADGEVAAGIKGHDPITSEPADARGDRQGREGPGVPASAPCPVSKVRLPELKPRRGARYTPLSRRQDRPNAILWLIRNHPELKDAQIMRLAGTTKTTLEAIRNRTHWNSAALTPMDPVTLRPLLADRPRLRVNRAAKDRPANVPERGPTLMPAEITTGPREQPQPEQPVFAPSPQPHGEHDDDIDVDSVFGKLNRLKTDS